MAKHVALTEDRTIVSWLTPNRRKALYGVIAALLTFGAAFGWLTDVQVTQWQGIAEQVLGIVVAVLAALHTGGVYTGVVQVPDDEAPKE